MALYSCSFRWIIERINARIKGASNYASIGILDIFGFENFEVTGFCLFFSLSYLLSHVLYIISTFFALFRQIDLNNLTSTMPTRNYSSSSTNTSFHWNSMNITGILLSR